MPMMKKPPPPGRGRGGMTPPPGMMYGPNDRLIPIPKKGGGGAASGDGRPGHMGPGSGGAPISGGRGIVKGLNPPKKSAPRPPVNPQRGGPRGMKSGGMVKGKK